MIHTKAWTQITAVAAAAALATTLAACGGSSSSGETSAVPTETSAAPTSAPPTSAAPTETSAEPTTPGAESVSVWAKSLYDAVDTMSDVPRTEQLLALVVERRAAVEAIGATVAVEETATTMKVIVKGDQTCEVIADDEEMSMTYSCF